MKRYNRYQSYKDSGVEWIGVIPGHWKKFTINALTKAISRKNRPELQLLSVYRDYGVILKNSRNDNFNKAGQDLSAYKYVEPNNLVLNKMKTWQGSLGVSEHYGIVSPAYITCEIDTNVVFPKYFHYLLRSQPYIHEYSRLSYGIRTAQWDMRYDDFKKILVYLPTFDEQKQIVRFLDRKTAQIDDFIAKKERLIELLKEQKAAIINRAVTKGINPDAPMKPSGIEWLGDIPAHWKRYQVKRLLKDTTYGLSESASDDGDFKYLNMGHIQDGEVVLENVGFLSTVPEELLLDKHDLLYNRTNSEELVAKVGIFWGNKNDKVTFASYLVRFRVNHHHSSVYLNYLLNSHNFISFARTQAYKSLHQSNLNPNRYIRLSVYVPEKNEQFRISEFISRKLHSINTGIQKTQQVIEFTKEYRQSLIAHAVTGKIDVRREVRYPAVETELGMVAERKSEL